MIKRRLLMGLAVATPLARPAIAQSFPARPITIIMPVAPGGPGDVLGRPLAAALSAELGQPVVIDNRTGAGGTIAMDFAARQRPDGHTIILASNSTYAIAPHLYQTPYDNDRAFAPLALLAVAPSFLTLHRSVPANTVAEFIALCRARPEAITFATAGIGFTSHLATELFMAKTGVSMLHVPYRGGAPATQALLAGECDCNFMEAAFVRALIGTGNIKPLAITTAQRSPLFPDIPTLQESGVEGFESATYWGMMAPAGVPQPVLDRITASVLRFSRRDETRAAVTNAGFIPLNGDAAAFAAHQRADTALWGDVIRTRGIRLS
ncbi:Bug family tripartite tricarboxylate transporter substrate binding protein [Plastoroseomonas arctica]|uniref:Tripartite tricarboxylate transporter substrate binding protein n=1 Tax=Plastoroseomonas arctica TaxID=1509237 RepID=A0AAF1JWE5_9PROT|nr:tripartite tricarboxylate transporter substrate binding protein [Plastoroseomonas arctica]MBR0655102.1 tripartite tricarboxylate transporter substrate binding protein [Plastoroseomonas arctica]